MKVLVINTMTEPNTMVEEWELEGNVAVPLFLASGKPLYPFLPPVPGEDTVTPQSDGQTYLDYLIEHLNQNSTYLRVQVTN